MHFRTLEAGIQFYKDYGLCSGFDVRRSTTKKFKNEDIRVQYVVCNREGYKNSKKPIPGEASEHDGNVPKQGARKRASNRVGCNARCIFEYTSAGSYKHASLVYKHAIFYEVSKEIKEACYHCSVIQINDNTNEISYTIKEESGVFQVTKCKIDASAKCSCKLFEQMRLLCRHIFVILKDCDEIPAPYLAARWMKATSFNSHSKNGHMYQFPGGIEAARTLNTLWADFHSCIGLAQGDIEKLSSLSRIISNEKAKLLEEQHETTVPNKQSVMETYCGSTSQLHISVLPPKQAKNKGSGSHLKSRLQSQREKAIKASTKLKKKMWDMR
ncbi:hypothetical protein DH2020_041097 [Rehmannia glutinosa]|uniref:SWIM-type domain-containing protein n=1 Tax=Rehmannia glutinosa TaxID=99300 RepID=A0ABR0UR62_REHGL